MRVVGIKGFEMPRRRRQRERQKGNRLNSETRTLHVYHAFLYISFPLLQDYDGKIPNFTFYGGRKQATVSFLSLSELEYGSYEFGSKEFACIRK